MMGTAREIIKQEPEGAAAGSASLLTDLNTLMTTPFARAREATDAYLAFAMQATGVRSAFLSQIDAQSLHITDVRDRGGCDIPQGHIFTLEETCCQYVRATNMPVVITNAAQDDRVKNVAMRVEYQLGAYLGVPVVLGNGQLHGTLCVLDPQPHNFTRAHIDTLQMLARMLALLLEREQLMSANRSARSERDAALAALEERTTLLKIVAHDLRTPLHGIYGFVDLLAHSWGEPSDEIANIRIALQFINRLTNDLLDMSASEAGTIALLNERIAPAALAESALNLCRFQAKQRGLELHSTYSENLPELIGDAMRIRQILLNLLSNALHYTDAGRITLAVRAEGAWVEFRISDTGPGIPEALHTTIWNLHMRAATEGRGLGLGLYLVRKLTQALGGVAGMESTPGVGSSFWVRLPLHGPRPQQAAVINRER